MRSDRLRDFRQYRGYTQGELADLVNIGQKQIWRYENGETEPDGVTVARIAQALETSADYLLGLTDDPTPYVMKESDLTPKERGILAALRHGQIVEAIRLIVQG